MPLKSMILYPISSAPQQLTVGWNFSVDLKVFILPSKVKLLFFCSGVLLERDSAISKAPVKVTSHFHSMGMAGLQR